MRWIFLLTLLGSSYSAPTDPQPEKRVTPDRICFTEPAHHCSTALETSRNSKTVLTGNSNNCADVKKFCTPNVAACYIGNSSEILDTCGVQIGHDSVGIDQLSTTSVSTRATFPTTPATISTTRPPVETTATPISTTPATLATIPETVATTRPTVVTTPATLATTPATIATTHAPVVTTHATVPTTTVATTHATIPTTSATVPTTTVATTPIPTTTKTTTTTTTTTPIPTTTTTTPIPTTTTPIPTTTTPIPTTTTPIPTTTTTTTPIPTTTTTTTTPIPTTTTPIPTTTRPPIVTTPPATIPPVVTTPATFATTPATVATTAAPSCAQKLGIIKNRNVVNQECHLKIFGKSSQHKALETVFQLSLSNDSEIDYIFCNITYRFGGAMNNGFADIKNVCGIAERDRVLKIFYELRDCMDCNKFGFPLVVDINPSSDIYLGSTVATTRQPVGATPSCVKKLGIVNNESVFNQECIGKWSGVPQLYKIIVQMFQTLTAESSAVIYQYCNITHIASFGMSLQFARIKNACGIAERDRVLNKFYEIINCMNCNKFGLPVVIDLNP